jgi:hypothetical protein
MGPEYGVPNRELQAEGGGGLPAEDDGVVIWGLDLLQIFPDGPFPKI